MFFGIPQAQFDSFESPIKIFLSLAHGFHNAVPITRATPTDKEYHFQNWVKRRIEAVKLPYKELQRNGYPDFVLNDKSSGYEVKGVTQGTRDDSFDSNSRLPLAIVDGTTVYYVFGRYPASDDVDFPVHDLVMCSASFFNAEKENTNKNQSFHGGGSYGDIQIRDRRMYVLRTPWFLVSNTAKNATLILEDGTVSVPAGLDAVGQLQRVEAAKVVTGYSFDLQKNTLKFDQAPNPSAGQVHTFTAYRVKGYGQGAVAMNPPKAAKAAKAPKPPKSPKPSKAAKPTKVQKGK